MLIHGALYVDHQTDIRFPIARVARAAIDLGVCDKLTIFASDDAEAAAVSTDLAADGLSFPIEKSGVKIADASDISGSMNACVKALKDRADFVLLIQADTLATERTAPLLRSFATPENIDKCGFVLVDNAVLYHAFGAGWGYSIVGRDWPFDFYNDGLGRAQHLCIDSIDCDDVSKATLRPTTLSLGYMSIDAAYRHTRQQAINYHSWQNEAVCRTFEKEGKDAFVRAFFNKLASATGRTSWQPVAETEPAYAPIIRDMGLEAEETYVRAIMGTSR